MDISAAGAALSHLKAAADIAKAVIDIRDAVKVEGKMLELIRELTAAELRALDAVRAQARLEARVQELEAKLGRKEDWATERERYELRQIIPGNFAYVLKEAVSTNQGVQCLCQNCFEQERKSPLNLLVAGSLKLYKCSTCGSQFSKA